MFFFFCSSDVWMLGLALWELLRVDDCGQPFAPLLKTAQIDQMMQQQTDDDGDDQHHHPVPLMWPGTEPHALRLLVEECCSFERKERPTIDEVVDRLVELEASTVNQPSGISLGKK